MTLMEIGQEMRKKFFFLRFMKEKKNERFLLAVETSVKNKNRWVKTLFTPSIHFLH